MDSGCPSSSRTSSRFCAQVRGRAAPPAAPPALRAERRRWAKPQPQPSGQHALVVSSALHHALDALALI